MKPDCPNCHTGKCNHLDTNANVTTQTHDYLTGAYDERMRIVELLETIAIQQQKVLEFNPTRKDASGREIVVATTYQLLALIKGKTK